MSVQALGSSKEARRERVEMLSQKIEALSQGETDVNHEMALLYVSYGEALLALYQDESVEFGALALNRASELGDGDTEGLLEKYKNNEENLDLAYQVLELARIFFENETKLKDGDLGVDINDENNFEKTKSMSQTFTLLGEVFLEWDDIDNHLEESQKALSLLHTLKSKCASLAVNIAQLLCNMAEGCAIHNKARSARSFYENALAELNGHKPSETAEIERSDALRKMVETRLGEFKELGGGKRKNAEAAGRAQEQTRSSESETDGAVNVPNVKKLK